MKLNDENNSISETTPLNNQESSDSYTLIINQENSGVKKIGLLSLPQSFHHMIKTAGPFTLANLFLAANSIGNGIILEIIGGPAVGAGLLTSTFAFSISSTVNGILLATGIFVGNLHGQKESETNGKEEIGALVRRSWFIAILLTIPSLALMLNSGAILKATNIEDEVADEVQKYFNAVFYGIPFIFLNFSNQQLTLGLNHQKIMFLSGIAHNVIAPLFGYPLALGLIGLPKCGIAGLGYGTGFAGILCFIGFTTYFLKSSEYKQYNLYKIKGNGPINFNKIKEFLKVGVPIGLQNLSEWGNLALLSMLLGQLGSNVLKAAQASFIPLSAYNVLILALTQASGVTLAKCLGTGIAALNKQDAHSSQVAQKNAKKLGYTAISMGGILSLIACALFVGIPEHIVSLFINANEPGSEEIQEMAVTILRINGVGLIADTVRNTAGGGLRGYKDVYFAPIVSFITMTVLGLSIGAILTIPLEKDPEWLYVAKNLGTLMAAFAILYRFYVKEPNNTKAQTTNGEASELTQTEVPVKTSNNYCFQFFRKSQSCLTGKEPNFTPQRDQANAPDFRISS